MVVHLYMWAVPNLRINHITQSKNTTRSVLRQLHRIQFS